MVRVPLASIAQISSKRLKPPQKTVGFSGIENKLLNKTKQTKTNKHTHSSGIISTKLTPVVIINAAKTVGNAGSAAFKENCRRRRVITSIYRKMLLSFQIHVFFRSFVRAKTKRRYVSVA